VFADPGQIIHKDRVIGDEQRWRGIGAERNAVPLVVHAYREENPNGEEVIRIVRPGKQIRVSAESIWNKPFTKRQKTALDGAARRQKRGDVSDIDYSDIPALTEKQLAQFPRPPKKLVAVRLDADVFEWLQQYGAGYSTRINNILRVVMSRDRAKAEC
jgi:uncharacterized protein (DUF4415 family)